MNRIQESNALRFLLNEAKTEITEPANFPPSKQLTKSIYRVVGKFFTTEAEYVQHGSSIRDIVAMVRRSTPGGWNMHPEYVALTKLTHDMRQWWQVDDKKKGGRVVRTASLAETDPAKVAAFPLPKSSELVQMRKSAIACLIITDYCDRPEVDDISSLRNCWLSGFAKPRPDREDFDKYPDFLAVWFLKACRFEEGERPSLTMGEAAAQTAPALAPNQAPAGAPAVSDADLLKQLFPAQISSGEDDGDSEEGDSDNDAAMGLDHPRPLGVGQRAAAKHASKRIRVQYSDLPQAEANRKRKARQTSLPAPAPGPASAPAVQPQPAVVGAVTVDQVERRLNDQDSKMEAQNTKLLAQISNQNSKLKDQDLKLKTQDQRIRSLELTLKDFENRTRGLELALRETKMDMKEEAGKILTEEIKRMRTEMMNQMRQDVLAEMRAELRALASAVRGDNVPDAE
ncbi:hypothetical protein MCOR09_001196 [Pyricularia oryzae]|nr:hypothetical protein MCOR09_001196 [Pyricularia oryzae]